MITALTFFQATWLKALLCLVSSYLISFFSIKKYINFVAAEKRFFQPIRDDGPQTHLSKKNTPTMGGIFIILATLISTALFTNFTNPYILIICFVFFSFALIGLTDDLMKVLHKNTKGFRGGIKLIIQFTIIGAAFLWLGYVDSMHMESRVFIPLGRGHWIGIGFLLYVLFVNIVIVGTSNAVNLTDGLDGLVSVPAIISLICLIAIIFVGSDANLAKQFRVPYIKNSFELIFFCTALIGSILAFLRFNLSPAKIFMGDVGSLAIGSALGIIAIIIKEEFVFFVIAILFVAEAVSVMLQVGSYKLRKKRIFLMAPLHHHFEKLGWSEQKVVHSFWTISLLLAIIGMAIFFL